MKVEMIKREQLECAVCESRDLTVYYKLTNIPYSKSADKPETKYLCHICGNYIYSAIDDSIKQRKEVNKIN